MSEHDDRAARTDGAGGGAAETGDAASTLESLASAERVKAFTDAVVAIAMTLLILPLLDTISDAAAQKLTTLDWLQENSAALIVFVLSFVIIANFWVSHHRLFARVDLVSNGLLWITIAWMLTIVWLPVATAMTGQMDTDPLQEVLYIGTMALSSTLLLVARLYLRAHPELHSIPPDRLRRGLLADVIIPVMFLVCLVVAVASPVISYSALFLMFLVVPIHRVALGVLGRRERGADSVTQR
ncbi:TMEM175 family protein [Microbacterium sp. Root61]|uniref:TMEM175 family protein n=1 Tax=Microbacterium sp. Root61 TaxID=1736570 RepID=UPI000AE9B46A|nr:TMEM175 family protein [Microbacterium sp. Root61]